MENTVFSSDKNVLQAIVFRNGPAVKRMVHAGKKDIARIKNIGEEKNGSDGRCCRK